MFQGFTPRQFTKLIFDVMGYSARAFGAVWPDHESRAAWREFANKLQAFTLFEHVDSILDLDPGRGGDVVELVRRALELGPYVSVWVLEGLGHYCAEATWEGGETFQSVLYDAPPQCLVPLHAGMGLSLADRVLRSPRLGLDWFVEQCRENSVEGYAGVIYESLGLVARNLYPHLVSNVSDEMRAELAEYFWHGVGRAIYFAPTNFPPFGNPGRRALECALREPTHEAGRRNALAGLGWALALVNVRHPEVLDLFLQKNGPMLASNDAFENGVASADQVWRVLTGNQAPRGGLGELFRYHPTRQGAAQ